MFELRVGDRGAQVQVVQVLLNSYALPKPPNLQETAEYDTRTRDAVIAFQKSKGLPGTGMVDMKTWGALGMATITSPMVAVSSVYPWMRVARAELLIHEYAAPGQNNQRIIEYHSTTTLKATDDETPWCSSFVNWVIKKAGYRGTSSAAAKSWLDYGSKLLSPREGAVTIIKKKANATSNTAGTASGFHVAFLVSSNSASLRLLGGNQSNRVQYSDFSLTKWELKGCSWPL